jgi:hypothetical protein
VFAPLWSKPVGQREGFIRLCGEMTERIKAVRGPSTPSTRPVNAEFRGTSYQVMVFNGTLACTMAPPQLGSEMLTLLTNGITEVGVTALLSRWSIPAPADMLPQPAEGSGAAASSGATA